MLSKLNLLGQRFGNLTVIERLPSKNHRTMWCCLCDCGNIITVRGSHLSSGHTKSCGCYQKEQASKSSIKHGKSNTRLFHIWIGMKKRCYNKNCKSYKDYGARGIEICDEWLNNFESFYNWANNNGYTNTLTIDRIDVNGNYEPNNCRWATQIQQVRNSRHNRYFTYKGEQHCLSEWCEILGLKYKNVIARINQYDWSIEEALELKERK